MLVMPPPNAQHIAARDKIAADLRRIVPPKNVISEESARRVYESDAFTAYSELPLLVVLPENVAQISQILSYCYEHDLKIVPRGAGTSLSGGSMPLKDGIILGLAKFNKILEIDAANRLAVVQPGVTNLGISQAVAHLGLYYAPDPSSQIACSIGGNVAENSGGVHCLKYGLTTNNILGLEMVLIDGTVMRIGGKHLDAGGYDLLGIMTGSEGLLGVVTEVTVRLLAKPIAAQALLLGFPSIEQAGKCVSAILAEGIIPAGMELMDQLSVQAIEAFLKVGYPTDVAALMIVEIDGTADEVADLIGRCAAIANSEGACSVQTSRNDAERLGFWAGRKAAFTACGQLAPDYFTMDGSVPRRCLAEVLSRMKELSDKYGLRVSNVFHAGDGNLHPLILYDSQDADQLERAEQMGADILRLCVEVGGCLTGEHGVGVEKRDLMPLMFNETDLAQQMRLKCAFDPTGLLNPGKVFPQLARCAEHGAVHVHHHGRSDGNLRFPDLPRF
ncbi:MAG: FAD-binding protein [Alphaproteobacteria bacterium]|nr:FAD-binding protein [Alphaproteobacteria bacterium]